MSTHTIIQGDVRAGLRTLPDGCVHCTTSSPPYFGLRDYGVDGQIGLEDSLEDYIKIMVEIGKEIYRVLRPDGVFFLNLGDCYAGSGKGPSKSLNANNPHAHEAALKAGASNVPAGLKSKDLMGVPWRVALALQEGGATNPRTMREVGKIRDALLSEFDSWDEIPRKVRDVLEDLQAEWEQAHKGAWYLRSDIIWAKPNCMPSSVKDRPTTSHEYIFLLTKKPRYFWDGEAIREPVSDSYAKDKRPVGILRQRVNANTKYPRTGQYKQQKLHSRAARPPGTSENNPYRKTRACEDLPRSERRLATGKTGFFHEKDPQSQNLTRNARSVWVISPQPRPEAHFATFPDELARRCIKAGTSEKGCCPKCGAPYRRIVVCSGGTTGQSWNPHLNDGETGHMMSEELRKTTLNGTYRRESRGWEPTCTCNAGDPVPCTVLDPFMGSGTVACMARDLGRNSIGIELNPEYVAIAKKRLRIDEQVPSGNIEYFIRKVPA